LPPTPGFAADLVLAADLGCALNPGQRSIAEVVLAASRDEGPTALVTAPPW
jgi:hypothetical protein